MTTMLPNEIKLGIDIDQLQTFSSQIDINFEDDSTEMELANAIITKIDGMTDEEWNDMTIELKEWSNGINSQKLELANAPKKTAKKKTAKTAKTSKEKETPDINIIINVCSTKADIMKTAEKFAKENGKSIKLAKSWTVAKLKEEAIKQLSIEGKEEEKEQPKKAKTQKKAEPPKPSKNASRITSNAKAKSPSAKEVKKAKDAAKNKAKAGAKASAEGKGLVDGEPYRRETTAWMVWDVFDKTKKDGLSKDEATKLFLTAFKKSGFKSKNPEGRVTRVMADMMAKGILVKNVDMTYSLTS